MTAPIGGFWTVERVEQLRALVAEGLPYDAIGAQLGTSKSAVIGKASRLGIAETHPNAAGPVRDKTATADIFPPSGRCVFPHGHPGQSDFHFCGDPVARVGLPYCPTHIAKAYQPAPVKQRQAAE